jgi:hypothetical protein
MRFVAALFIVEILVLIFWILGSLVVRMLTLRLVNVAELSLKGLVFALGESLVVPVIAPVVTLVIPVVALVRATLVKCSTMRVATLVAAIVASVALVRKMANLVVVALQHLVSEFAFCAKLDLQIEDVVKILGNSCKFLVEEALSALEVPSTVLLVERHVEPLNFECVVVRGHVPGRKGFGRAKHLFEPAKMID